MPLTGVDFTMTNSVSPTKVVVNKCLELAAEIEELVIVDDAPLTGVDNTLSFNFNVDGFIDTMSCCDVDTMLYRETDWRLYGARTPAGMLTFEPAKNNKSISTLCFSK